ncbi:MAG: leucine-rich repeat protein, partial [Pontiellaceae bacterium]|nr:leucine-rich repeat protein [Pontiellaceae bacterium]
MNKYGTAKWLKKNFFTQGACFAVRSVLLYLLIASSATAAPFAKQIQFTQPDGTVIELWGEGDDFHAVFETLDGYTVVFDPAVKTYFYATLSADGNTLKAANLKVGKGSPASLGLRRHLRMSAKAKKDQVAARHKKWDEAMGVSRRWNELKAARQSAYSSGTNGCAAVSPGGTATALPAFATTGTKVGLCLLIDFDNDPATIPQAEIVNFCNGDNYTGFGNNGSVKKYFKDNSDNKLTYSNVVTVYIRIPNSLHPKSWYDDPSKNCISQGPLLIRDAIAIMTNLPNYKTAILPSFNSLTMNGDYVAALNVFYAGNNSGAWTYGLWPHASWLSGQIELSPGGKKLDAYQITNIGASLELGTFCHENGHMLMGFPDIYDYGYDSVGGAGQFCLMDYGGYGVNPVEICAYLKWIAGWATTIELADTSNLTATLTASTNRFYRYAKPGVPTEYFLFENRQKTGRDSDLPASGIAIWHIDERGDHNNQSLLANTNHENYEVTLVQADNQWHFQSYANSGDAEDLYYSGNAAPAYTGQFSDLTSPNARWWDGSLSHINVGNFGASGNTMTFSVRPKAAFVTPDDEFVTSGFQGGSFTPSNKVYTVTAGGSGFSWSVNCLSDWVNIAPRSGTLAAGAMANVVVSIKTNAGSLSVGAHRAIVSFTNSSGAFQNVEVNLTVKSCIYTTNADNTLTVSGFVGSDGYVIIPDTINGRRVTCIGNNAFAQNGLTGITIGNNVTNIMDSAFFGSGLTNVTIPASVAVIGSSAFEQCASLTGVTILNGVKSIEGWAFRDCSGLTTITIPNSVTNIGALAFYACPGLTSVTLPNSIKNLQTCVFYYCPGLTSITIPASVTNIEDYAFAQCSGLRELYFQGNAPVPAGLAFYNCTNLVMYYVPGTTGWGSAFGGWPVAVWNQTNLVLNPSFEAGGTAPASWTRGGSAVGSGASAQNGTNSLRIATSGVNGPTTQTIAIQSGKTYDISVWINAAGLTAGPAIFDTGDKYDGAGQGQFLITAANGGWTKYSGRFTATNTSVTLRMFTESGFRGTVYFDNVVLAPSIQLPSPWQARDISTVGKSGGTTYNSGTYTLMGAGKRVGDISDSFHYVHQVSSGDCDIKVKVLTLTNTASAAKSGVAIRETLNGNARAAGVWVTPTNGIIFTARTATGGTTTNKVSTGKKAPYWVRLTRTGNTFKAYYGTTGTNWTQLGASTTIS